jgi:signal transduction histidine kinase/streptogramin lyase
VLWAATWDGLDRFDPLTRRFTVFKVDSHSSRSQLYLDAVEDERGIIWLGSNNSGVHRFDPTTGRFTVYQHSPTDSRSLSNNRVNSVFLTRSGTLWAGTQHGLDEFHPETGTFTVYDSRRGLAGNVVSCVREDTRGNLWMSTNAGVSTFDPVRKSFANYSIADGLPGPDLTGWGACFKSSRGEMFFGGFSGATSFFPDSVVNDRDTAAVVLTDLRVSGMPVRVGAASLLERSVAYTHTITLPYEKKAFSVEFSALSFLNPAAIRYRYRLEGLDPAWNEVTSDDRHASYSTLPAGGYTLRVQAATQRGAWSSPGAELRIDILPPWWRTWWFRGLMILLVATLAILAHVRRIARLEARQRGIAAGLRSRYQAALDERTRIAQELHDSLLQGFTGVSLQLEAVRRMLPAHEAPAENLATVLATADATLRDARAMIWDLRTPELEAHELPVALECAARRLIGDAPVTLRLTTGGVYRQLDPAVETTVLRVTREAVANALRHGAPSRIEIEITYEPSTLEVVIADDGRGIHSGREDAAMNTGHWGIRGMRERVARQHGTLELRSAPGKGCVVSVCLPVELRRERPIPYDSSAPAYVPPDRRPTASRR